MKNYIGTKIINAKPMDRAAYNTFRGWTLPADEDGADAGYLVEYTDGGKPNTSAYEGYVSWSPADVFERSYRPTTAPSAHPAPTVTLQGIRDKIKSATYTLLPNSRTTVCQLTMENGFTIEGQSACVSLLTYNRALGEKYAYEDALSNIWKFEGYLLAERLFQAPKNAT